MLLPFRVADLRDEGPVPPLDEDDPLAIGKEIRIARSLAVEPIGMPGLAPEVPDAMPSM